MRLSSLLILMSLARCAYGQLDAPRAGWTVDVRSVSRQVFGFDGNYWLGPGVVPGVVSAAFSNSGAMLKTRGSILLLDGSAQVVYRENAPAGPARFGFTSLGAPALVYYPSTRALLRYSGGHLMPVPADWMDGEVISLAMPDSRHVLLVTRRNGATRSLKIQISDGAVAANTTVPDVAGPVLVQPDGSLFFQRGAELVARSPQGIESATPAAFVAGALFAMGNGWIQVNEKNGLRRFSWNPTLGHERIFQLPEEAR